MFSVISSCVWWSRQTHDSLFSTLFFLNFSLSSHECADSQLWWRSKELPNAFTECRLVIGKQIQANCNSESEFQLRIHSAEWFIRAARQPTNLKPVISLPGTCERHCTVPNDSNWIWLIIKLFAIVKLDWWALRFGAPCLVWNRFGASRFLYSRFSCILFFSSSNFCIRIHTRTDSIELSTECSNPLAVFVFAFGVLRLDFIQTLDSPATGTVALTEHHWAALMMPLCAPGGKVMWLARCYRTLFCLVE